MDTLIKPARTLAATTPDRSYPFGRGQMETLVDVVEWIADNEGEWTHHVRVPGADRWWTRLYAETGLDVWLLTWLPGQFTDLHDHGSSAAAFSVVRGQLEEARYVASGALQISACTPDEPTRVERGVVHDVRAVGDELAVSIHAYSPPLTQMTYYDLSDDSTLHVTRSVETYEPEQQLAV